MIVPGFMRNIEQPSVWTRLG